jgi:hypothetical protein
MRISSLVTPPTTKPLHIQRPNQTPPFDHAAGAQFVEAHELGLVSDRHDIH